MSVILSSWGRSFHRIVTRFMDWVFVSITPEKSEKGLRSVRNSNSLPFLQGNIKLKLSYPLLQQRTRKVKNCCHSRLIRNMHFFKKIYFQIFLIHLKMQNNKNYNFKISLPTALKGLRIHTHTHTHKILMSDLKNIYYIYNF